MDSTGVTQEASGPKVPFDGSRRQGCLLADSVLGDLSGLRRGSLVGSIHARIIHKTRLPNELHKGDTTSQMSPTMETDELP